jgi:Ca2+-binding EF-hand superfamily protein
MMSPGLFSSNFYTFYMNSVMHKMATDAFKKYDANQDEAITKDEFTGTSQAFELMDTDSDGEVSLSNMQDAFGLNPVSTPQSNILKDMLTNYFHNQIQKRDKNNDSALTSEEYVGEKSDFNRIDKDKSGKINADEMLQDYLAQNPDVARLISQIDSMNMLLDALSFMGKSDSHSYF